MKAKELRAEARKILSDALKTGTQEQKAALAIQILNLPPVEQTDE